MKSMQRNLLLLLFFLLPAAFQARADFTGPPMEAVVAVWALGLVGGFFACALVAVPRKTDRGSIYPEKTPAYLVSNQLHVLVPGFVSLPGRFRTPTRSI